MDVVEGMAEAVEARRRALGLNPGDFADAAGLTRQGAGNVRAGHRRKYHDDTIVGVARALRWERDWYERLLRGETPIEGPPAPASVDARLDALEDAVSQIRRLLLRLDTSEDAPPTDGGSR